jgi:hypothetical protein
VKTPRPGFSDKDAAERLADILDAQIEQAKAAKVAADQKIVDEQTITLVDDAPQKEKLKTNAAMVERDRYAFAAADSGDFEPLIRLVWGTTMDMPPNLRKLIIGLFSDHIDWRPRGRPQSTEERRRKDYPVHDAADEVALIIPLLREMYPGRKKGEIRDLAVDVAITRVKRRGYKLTGKSLLRHVTLSPKDRRRIQQ